MTIFDDHGRGSAQVNIVHEHDEQSADSTLQENAVAADVRRRNLFATKNSPPYVGDYESRIQPAMNISFGVLRR